MDREELINQSRNLLERLVVPADLSLSPRDGYMSHVEERGKSDSGIISSHMERIAEALASWPQNPDVRELSGAIAAVNALDEILTEDTRLYSINRSKGGDIPDAARTIKAMLPELRDHLRMLQLHLSVAAQR